MRYPQSFLKLLLAGFALVALPLVVALVISAIAVDRMANRGQAAVYQVAQATQSSRRLGELLTAMERSARQIVILNNRSLLDAYKISRDQFREIASGLANVTTDEEQRAELDAIVKTEQQIFDALSDPALTTAALQVSVIRFVDLSKGAQSIMARSGQLIDREVGAMRTAAVEVRRVMLWLGLSLLPMVVFLVIGFAILIARPIRQIDAAIRDLGDGKFNTPVTVNGPKDMQYLGERLDWMRRQLIDAEQQKNRFLQQISHELKTPLTALREGAQLLSDDVVGRLTPEQREILQIVRQNSIELQRRIEELLDYGSLQFHKLNFAPVDPGKVLERVAHTQKLALQAKNLTLRTQIEDGMLTADSEKIRVVLDNLLSNAIRFSPDGGTIAVSMRNDVMNLTIDVSDDGPGIAAADQPHIFEPYYQGRAQASGTVKGSGLGLSIVKEYVMAHGGSVEVVAVPGASGAHLRVRLPLSLTEAT